MRTPVRRLSVVVAAGLLAAVPALDRVVAAAGTAPAAPPAVPLAAVTGAVAEFATGGAGAGAWAADVVDACGRVAPPRVSCLAKRRLDVAGPLADGTPAGYGPAELRAAYRLPATGGAGQLVAIVDAYHNPNAEVDLAAYRAQFGLPACDTASGCLRIVNQDGQAAPLPTPDPGWALEIALDLDMVSAVCPSCRLLLVEATSNDLDDLGAAVDTAVRMGAGAVSNSYGTGVEFAGQLDYEEHYHHPGHAIVVSAGDLGYSVSFPAASRYVTSVGGTSLTRTAGGTWTESAWSGTGSGCSAYVPKPAWQDDPHCPMRMGADVAAVADPATGVAVRHTYQTASGWSVVGGTSASAPIVAGVYALAGTTDRVDGGALPWANRAAGGFRDVTTGSNVPSAFAVTCGGDYLCTGVAGYDGPTGWGTPQGTAGFTAG